MQKLLITVGIAAILLGLFWPWLAKLGLGKLPGDIIVKRDEFTLYLPVTTSILVSIVLSLLFWLFRK